MWDVRVCAACLATDVRMYSMSAVSLLEPYRLLTGIELEDEGMPQKLCWECAAQVYKFSKFRHKCKRASLLLQDIYNKHDEVSEQEVLRVNREQHNLISSFYTFSPIEVYNSEFLLNTKGKKSHKDKMYNIDRMAEKRNDIQKDKVLNEPFVKLELEIIKKEDVPIEIESEVDDTELIDDVFVEEDCSQAVLLEAPQTIKRVRKRSNIKRKQKSGRKLAKDFGMKEELLSQEQQMEVMREKQNTKVYKSARFPCTLCYSYFSEEKPFNNHKLKHNPVEDVEMKEEVTERRETAVKENADYYRLLDYILKEQLPKVLPQFKHVSGEFVCDICKLRYKTRRRIYGHIAVYHMNKYTCQSCPDVFYNRAAARKHNAWHKGVVYTCSICSAKFNRHTTYQNHLRVKHSSEHVCDQCGAPFHSKKGLLQHINMMHKGRFASGGEHETSGPHCAECDIQFTCKQAWTRHVLISPKHQHERHICALGCATCGETLPDEESLRAHRVIHRQQGIYRRPRNSTTSITCEQCGEAMESHHAYHAHFRRAHPDKTRTHYPAMRAPCMCELCGKVFQLKAHMKEHSYTHTGERPFQCDVCNKTFRQAERMRIHRRIHTKELPYKCDICGRGFTGPSNLRRHKTVHTNATPYPCEACGKCFKYRATARSHFQYVHMKKPWPKRDRSKRQNGNERRSRSDKHKLLDS